jgi:tRNA A37 threonylcarbamoyladenosine synthetase subunit TsaC/SUA5/YrdC
MTHHDPDAARVYAVLRSGGLALVPTDVGYGLLAMEAEAVERIYVLKGRPSTKPCVTVANEAILADVALPVGAGVVAWLRDITRTLPLAVVARLDPDSRLVASMAPFVRAQATHEGTIAAFFSAGPLVEAVAELARADGRLVVGSSANASGTGNNATLAEVPENMRLGADLIIDRGPVRLANPEKTPATILDLTTRTFLRRGVAFETIEQSWAAAQVPENTGLRFSTKALRPSRASSLANSFACSSRSSARPDSRGSSPPDCTARLM